MSPKVPYTKLSYVADFALPGDLVAELEQRITYHDLRKLQDELIHKGFKGEFVGTPMPDCCRLCGCRSRVTLEMTHVDPTKREYPRTFIFCLLCWWTVELVPVFAVGERGKA